MNIDHSVPSTELQDIIDQARERKRARLNQIAQWQYLQFIGQFKSIPEGTAIFDNALIFGYPKIGRILQIDTGIQAQLEHPFWIEEKIDGYNVRIFRQGNDILVLTRRGYLCPFTMDRLADLLNIRIFDERPDLVLCAEVAGPGNPYNEGSPPFVSEDVQLFVFDIMCRGQPGCLSQREKLQLVEAYDLPGVPQYGRYQLADLDKIKALMLKLDQEGREGIVLKEDSPRDRRVKYVTGSSNIADIQVNEGNIQQLPAEYFMHRILRLALFIEEHHLESTPDMHRVLGESLVNGTLNAVEQYRGKRKVYNTFRCRFRHRSNAELMMQAMKRRLGNGQVKQRRLNREGDFYILEFDKILPRTTGTLAQILKGGIIFD